MRRRALIPRLKCDSIHPPAQQGVIAWRGRDFFAEDGVGSRENVGVCGLDGEQLHV